jgi:hypothetical protein
MHEARKRLNGVEFQVEVPLPVKPDVVNWTPPPDGIPRRKYVNAMQCATVYKVGKRAGKRCTWYAVSGTAHCKKHQGWSSPRTPEMEKHRMEGSKAWWARMRELEKKSPGTMRRVFNTAQSLETRRKTKELEATILPKPESKDKLVVKAHKAAIRYVANLPDVPDKKLEAMEPHERMTHELRISIQRAHEVIVNPIAPKDLDENPKKVKLITETALKIMALNVKIDKNALQARKLDRMQEIVEALRKAASDVKTIEGYSSSSSVSTSSGKP